MKLIRTCHSVVKGLRDVIQSDDFLTAYRIGNAFTRKRSLTFTQMMYLLLFMSPKSLPSNRARFRRFFPKVNFPDVSRQAVSKARRGINPEAFAELFRVTVHTFYERKRNPKTWNNYLLLAIDGSKFQVPDTAENRKIFGENPNQSKGSGALATVSALFDVLNDIIVDTKIHPYRYGERKAALEHIHALEILNLKHDAVIICDRGYPSVALFNHLNDHGHKFVIRVSTKFKKIVSQNGDDCIHSYYDTKSKRNVKVRGIKIHLPNNTIEYLVTNLFVDSITTDDFSVLYNKRWGIESKYRELKSQIKVEAFSGTNHIAVKQDYYVAVVISNISSILKMAADEEIAARVQMGNKHQYQAGRNVIISSVKDTIVTMLTKKSIVLKLLNRIVYDGRKVKSIIRPGRSFDRPKKMVGSIRKYSNNFKDCL